MTEGDRPSTANSRHDDYTQRCWLAQKIFRVHSRTRARACCSTAVPTTVLRSSEMTFGLATPNFYRSFTRFLPLFQEPALLYRTNFSKLRATQSRNILHKCGHPRKRTQHGKLYSLSLSFFSSKLRLARFCARLRVPVHVPLYIFFTVSLLYTHREKNQLGRDKLLLLRSLCLLLTQP